MLSKLKLVDEAINILVESVKKRPTLWCAWLELANLIKTVETVIFNESHSFKSVVLFFLSFLIVKLIEQLSIAATLDERLIYGAVFHGTKVIINKNLKEKKPNKLKRLFNFLA